MNKVELHSDIKLTVFGRNVVVKDDIKTDKEGVLKSPIPARWQSKKDNRFDIKKGRNLAPEWVLDVPLVKGAIAAKKMTKGNTITPKNSIKEKAKKKTAKKVEVKDAELPKPDKDEK
jgi:hypothetical protein